MPYVDPDTIHVPASGDVPPSAWGATINDDFEYLVEMPYARVEGAGPSVSIASSTSTALTYPSATWDEFGMTTANSSRITVVEDGIYCMNATIQWGGNATGYRILQIQISQFGGAPFAYTQTRLSSNVGDGLVFNGAIMRRMQVGDWANVCAWQNSGGSLAVLLTQFSMRKMGRM